MCGHLRDLLHQVLGRAHPQTLSETVVPQLTSRTVCDLRRNRGELRIDAPATNSECTLPIQQLLVVEADEL